jgi:hypothetical protein
LFYTAVSIGLLWATQRQATISEKALKAIERPYVLMSSIATQNNFKRLIFSFENPSRTPAFIKELTGRHVVLAGDLPPTPEYIAGHQPFPPVMVVLGGRQQTCIVDWKEELRIPENQIPEIRSKQLNYYFFRLYPVR